MTVRLGPVELRTPLVAASGTVGSVVDAADAIDFTHYGAAVAKSVSGTPWTGRPAPRVAPTNVGMLNGIGIQNPGVEAWASEIGPLLGGVPVPVWGSAVGTTVDEFAAVAAGLEAAGVAAVEVNLSCPNLEEDVWALDAGLSAEVVGAVRATVDLPIGAKLSPNAPSIVPIAEAALAAGADWLVLTNTASGAGIDLERRRPSLSGVVGGYSGPGLKPIALRCVIEVTRALGPVPIVGTGGVRSGADVVEYVMAGASAVGLGTVHFEDPKAARRILREVRRWLDRHGERDLTGLVGAGVAA